jgi:hypothetical protein
MHDVDYCMGQKSGQGGLQRTFPLMPTRQIFLFPEVANDVSFEPESSLRYQDADFMDRPKLREHVGVHLRMS